MGNYQHDPFLAANATLLKQAGTEQYASGRQTTQKGLDTLDPVQQYFSRLLSGDTQTALGAVQPEVDQVTQSFDAVRKMISDQPRGGGKTGVLAQLPIDQIRNVSNLLAGARQAAPAGLMNVSQAQTGTGLTQTGQGLGAAGTAADIALGGRGQDIASSWKQFFQQLWANAAKGAGYAAAGG